MRWPSYATSTRSRAACNSDLNRQGPGATDSRTSDQVTHLRLIISAAELALLPFELATSPNGFPGAGQPLSLQTQQPICITRETRRFPVEYMRWPRRPRILFAFASPRGFEEVPAPAHLLALREALTPWLALSDDFDEDKRLKIIGDRLAVLPDVSAESLERACAENDFTHVHILAHGIEMDTPYDQRFGLALHSPHDPGAYEAVSGERLATILRTPRHDQPGQFTRPALVTLASCNSGNVGTVTGVGASIGHALHEAGIPLVMASQYPLSFGGSVMLVKDLYDGLLWGEDPRKLVVGLRRRLHSFFQDKHDWASIVTYASLPPDFDDQLADAYIQRAMDSINTAAQILDRVLSTLSANATKPSPSPANITADEVHHVLVKYQQQVAAAKKRLQRAIETYPTRKARILALLASTEKREAQMLYHSKGGGQLDLQSDAGREVVSKLEVARNYYWTAYLMQRSHSWELIQYLSLTLLRQGLGRLSTPLGRPQQDTASLWLTAQVQSLNDAESSEAGERAWAYGNLAELYLMAPLVEGLPKSCTGANATGAALDAAQKIVSLAGPTSFHVFSTRRQILRYIDWFVPITTDKFDQTRKLAGEMLVELPVCEEPEWDY